MSNLRTAAQQALEALTYVTRHFTRTPSTLKDSDARAMGHEAITALRAALEQPEPPPEAQTEAEKIAYCAGWWAAMEKERNA